VGLTARVEPLVRDIDLMTRDDLGAKGKSALLAAYALEAINDAAAQNKQALGAVPPYDIYVDGTEGAALTSVKPDGVIRAEFHLFGDVLAWIATQLETHSPVLTGRYAKSHELFADGTQLDNPNNPPPADEYVFTNIQPYARKIERGKSSQAPDGVYQAVATLAQRRFGNVAKITFSYRTVIGGERNPAIIVRLRG
jgi:hypothetical protein